MNIVYHGNFVYMIAGSTDKSGDPIALKDGNEYPVIPSCQFK